MRYCLAYLVTTDCAVSLPWLLCDAAAGEFGLFVKQLLYFDRYTRILAPQLKVFDDVRVNWKADGTGPFDGPEVTVIPPGSGGGYVYN